MKIEEQCPVCDEWFVESKRGFASQYEVNFVANMYVGWTQAHSHGKNVVKLEKSDNSGNQPKKRGRPKKNVG